MKQWDVLQQLPSHDMCVEDFDDKINQSLPDEGDQTSASWNQVAPWLRQIEELRRTA